MEKWLHNIGIMEKSRQLGLPYKSVSNIVDLWITTGSFKPRCPLRVDVNRTARTDNVIAYSNTIFADYVSVNSSCTHPPPIFTLASK